MRRVLLWSEEDCLLDTEFIETLRDLTFLYIQFGWGFENLVCGSSWALSNMSWCSAWGFLFRRRLIKRSREGELQWILYIGLWLWVLIIMRWFWLRGSRCTKLTTHSHELILEWWSCLNNFVWSRTETGHFFEFNLTNNPQLTDGSIVLWTPLWCFNNCKFIYMKN